MTKNIIQHGVNNVKGNLGLNLMRQESSVAVEILSGSDELALDLLGMNGFTAPDVNGSVKLYDVRNFYGVSESYFDGVLNRHRITYRNTPEYIYLDQNTTCVMMSARLALAMSAIMCCGRSVPEDSVAARVYASLRSTRYYRAAEASVRERQDAAFRKCQATERLKQVVLNDSEEIEAVSDGRLLISAKCLADLVGFMMNVQQIGNSSEISNEVKLAQLPMETKQIATVEESKSRNWNWKRKPIATAVVKDGVKKVFHSRTECAAFLGVSTTKLRRAIESGRRIRGYGFVPAQ